MWPVTRIGLKKTAWRRPRSQKLASDGLTPVTVDALYREVYHRKHLQAAEESVQLLPGREVFDISSGPDGYVIATRSSLSGGGRGLWRGCDHPGNRLSGPDAGFPV